MGSRRRATSTRSWPSLAASRASSAPMPLDAPVMSAMGRVEMAMMMNPFGDEWHRRASAAGEGGGALLDEMRHAFLEIFGAERCQHLLVGLRPGFGERLEIRLEDLPLDDADRTRRRRGDKFARDRLHASDKILSRQFANEAKAFRLGGLHHPRRI